VQFGLRFDPPPSGLKGSFIRLGSPHTDDRLEMAELGLDNDTGKPRRLFIEGGGRYQMRDQSPRPA
jgi:hypothetical protein